MPLLPAPVVAVVAPLRSAITRTWAWQWLKSGDPHLARAAAVVASVFDREFYAASYGPSLGGREPVVHYLESGWRRRFDPSPMFSTGWYLDHYVAEGHQPVEPLGHYLTEGWKEGRDPSPWFSTRWYGAVNPDIGPDTNPLVHFVEHGHFEGRTVSESHTTELVRRGRERPVAVRQVGFESARLLADGGDEIDISLRAVAVGSAGLVSFDLWDTLVMRDRPADAAKVATARRMAIAGRAPSRTWLLHQHRVDLEAVMASEVAHQEYAIEEVLLRTLREAGVEVDDPVALARELADAELEDEIQGTTPVPEAFELVHRLTHGDASPTVVVLSDFYIGADGLGRLLRHHGIDTDRIAVICSVDEGASKRLGSIYQSLHERYGVAPEHHLHIGDNPHADGQMARAAGAQAIIVTPCDRHLPGPGQLTQDWYTQAVAELETELDEIAATMLGRSSANVAQRTALAAGVRSAALVVPHVAGAIERAIELGVDCVHYLSREGASLARLHEQVAEVMFGRWAPRAVHLEVSRRSTFGPSLRSLDDESLQRMWSQYADQSPVGLIASLGLEPASFRKRLATAGLDPDTVIPDIAGDRRIRSFLQTPDVARTMRCALDEQRRLLVRYLSDRGLGGERHVVVDVGWRGTIQDNLCHLLPHTELHGVYFGLFPYLNPQPANSTKRAVVFDGNLGERYDMVNPPAAIEAPLTPPIASVARYVDVAGRVQPVGEPEYGRAEDLVLAFQEGLDLGASTAARRYGAWGATTEMLRHGLQASLQRYYEEPAPGAADIWFFSSHDDTFGALNVTPYGKHRPSMSLTYGTTEPRDRPDAAHSQWREGWAAWLPVRSLDVLRHQRQAPVPSQP